jgi:hypothetical protein
VKRVTKRTAPPLVAWRGLQRARDIVKRDDATTPHSPHQATLSLATRRRCFQQLLAVRHTLRVHPARGTQAAHFKPPCIEQCTAHSISTLTPCALVYNTHRVGDGCYRH